MDEKELKQQLQTKLRLRERMINARVQLDSEIQKNEGQILLLQEMIQKEEDRESGT